MKDVKQFGALWHRTNVLFEDNKVYLYLLLMRHLVGHFITTHRQTSPSSTAKEQSHGVILDSPSSFLHQSRHPDRILPPLSLPHLSQQVQQLGSSPEPPSPTTSRRYSSSCTGSWSNPESTSKSSSILLKPSTTSLFVF